ncbi:MAG: DEAD/DEAH box helicase [Nitrospira sp.]|nr:DEAD/DEAH box helicase [Nitrospira sp.]
MRYFLGMNDSRARLAAMMPDAFPVFFDRRNPYEGQLRVMPEIVRGRHMLFAAPTASGKTEAAVCPLFQRHLSFRRSTLSTVYVAPTKALVNDLYERLVAYLGARYPNVVARYTGDRHELKSTEGVFCCLVTPEALDSLQLRRPEALSGVRAVVVDEIHLLHGQPRGQQLRHVIDRIRQSSKSPRSTRDGFHVVGMTATLDNMNEVARIWLGDDAEVISHGSPREIDLQLIHIPADAHADPNRVRARYLAQWIEKANLEKTLVFANSRNAAHALAAHLHRELDGKRWPVHLHFGPLTATHREHVEKEMRESRFGVCVATATLEIGIDIGDIDAIVLGDLPLTVSGFLQRVGRGNRRSGLCRVIAFRGSDDDERIARALVDCGMRGELDDSHEYDRPSVHFQQVLSLCWRATRKDQDLTTDRLVAEAGTSGHDEVVRDMLTTGCLSDLRGALVPADRLLDEGDAGRIHTVIRGQPGSTAVDLRTGEAAIRDADRGSVGGAVYFGGSMRRLTVGADGGTYLADKMPRSNALARIRATSGAMAMSRSIVWGLARQIDQDPSRWKLEGATLITWGGVPFNTLLAALLMRQLPGRQLHVSVESVSGPLSLVGISIEGIQQLADQAEQANDLPLSVAEKFANPTRFIGELSRQLSAVEKRRSIPWPSFRRWLTRVGGIDVQ